MKLFSHKKNSELLNTFCGQLPRTFWVIIDVEVPVGEVRPNERSVLVVSQSPVPSCPRRAVSLPEPLAPSQVSTAGRRQRVRTLRLRADSSVAACPPAPRAGVCPTPWSPSQFSR